MKAGRTIAISVDEAPAEADSDRETWTYYGVRSTLAFPLSPGGGPLIGVLSFAAATEAEPVILVVDGDPSVHKSLSLAHISWRSLALIT